eukprot:scaffold86881_cov40-Phaeocystis_antarctica.AAC.2
MLAPRSHPRYHCANVARTRCSIPTTTARAGRVFVAPSQRAVPPQRGSSLPSTAASRHHVEVAATRCTADGCGLGGAVLHRACRHCRRLCPKHRVAARCVLCLLEGGGLCAEAALATRVRVPADGHARGLTARHHAGAGLC